MGKSTTDELVKALDKKPKAKKTKGTPWYQLVGVTVWESRPIHWLAIGLVYTSVAYFTYKFATYYIVVPQFTGIVTFVATWAIGSRTFKKR